MQIRYHCPTDSCVAIIEYEPIEGCGETMTCPRCKVAHPMRISPTLRRDRIVDRCVVCGGAELFIRKDFPQKLGLAIVVIFGLAAIYCFTFSVLAAWTVLASAVVLDLFIYFVIGKVTSCYACRAEYRRGTLNPAHEGFNLATSEKY